MWVNRVLRWTSIPQAAGAAGKGSRARWSIWEQLRDDPGAQALRAQWESRWDEF